MLPSQCQMITTTAFTAPADDESHMNTIYNTLCDEVFWWHAREIFTVLCLCYLVVTRA